MRNKAIQTALSLTDLPKSKWWGFWIRFFKTFEVLIFRVLQILDLYRAQKSILCIPTLFGKNVTSLQAVIYNGTQEEVLGFRPRRLIHRVLRGLPDLEFYERVQLQLSVGQDKFETAAASTESRGFIHVQVPWKEPDGHGDSSWLRVQPQGVDTLLGLMKIGDYEIVSAPVFFLTGKIKWIIISDIDDTIKDSKISETTGFRQIVKSVFRGNYYTYDAITGMAELYQNLVKQGCLFVYVTSTPYQLAPFLLKFLRSRGFPEGPVYPRWLGYGRFGHKWRTIQRVLNGTGDEKVVLIGDSGEQDLQIYRRLSGTPQFKDKIQKILIRHVPGTPLQETRSEKEVFYKEIPELEQQLSKLMLE